MPFNSSTSNIIFVSLKTQVNNTEGYENVEIVSEGIRLGKGKNFLQGLKASLLSHVFKRNSI